MGQKYEHRWLMNCNKTMKTYIFSLQTMQQISKRTTTRNFYQKSHMYQHLMSSKDRLDKRSKDCFSVLDTSNTKHQLRIK